MMVGLEYKDASVNMKKTGRSLMLCAYALRRFVKGGGDAIPTSLMDDMVLLNRLFDEGHYFFRL